jgi:alpha-L-fucosidase
VVSVDSEEPGAENQAVKAIDDDPKTFWHTQWVSGNPGYPHEIVLDLGEVFEVGGFTYLPRQDGKDGGLVARYALYVSVDGRNWGQPVAEGEFANILNNPVLQRVVFTQAKRGRYVRLVALASPNGKPWAGAAELGVLEAKAIGSK